MKSCMYLQSIIVALCLGYVLSRGLEEQKKIVSANLEVVSPWHDCLRQLRKSNNNTTTTNNNASRCDVDLFAIKSKTLRNMDNSYYLLKVEIGSKKQVFKMHVDTGSDKMWVLGTNCKNSDPKCKGHPKYDPATSTTFHKVEVHGGPVDFKFSYAVGEVKGFLVKDTIYIADTLTAVGHLFGSVGWIDAKMKEDGVLGLNMNTQWGANPVITAMKAAGMKPIFSLYLKWGGSAFDGGEITFGGINDARLKSFRGIQVPVIGGHKFILQMDEVRFGDKVMCTKAGRVNCKALIDSGDSLLDGPKKLIDDFTKDVLKSPKIEEYADVKCSDIRHFPDMNIKFGNVWLKLEAKYYTEEVNLNECVSKLFGMNTPDGTWIFGQPFLQKFVTEFDMTPGDPTITFYEAKQ